MFFMNEWIKKCYVYHLIIKKKEILLFAITWINFEGIMLSEMSKKDRYYLIPPICGISEKAMAPYCSTLAWKILWMEEPGSLQSMGSLGVGHDWAISLSLFTFIHWRRKWQPTPVFLPGESQGWGSLVGCCLWGHTVRHDWSDLAAYVESKKTKLIEME